MPFIDVDGHPFHYQIADYSDPWKPRGTVLLHHAAAGTLVRWRAWVPTLARRYRVIRFDMRGYGGTPAPTDLKFSLRGLASDVASLMDALEVQKVHWGLRRGRQRPAIRPRFPPPAPQPRPCELDSQIGPNAYRRSGLA